MPMPPTAYLASDAQAYERSMGRWSRLLADRMLAACPALPPAARILDVGCGTGALGEAVTARDPAAKVIGVDLSPTYLAAARETAPGTRVAAADAARLPLPDDAGLDAALSGLVLAFVPDPAAVVREMARVTRPGGVVAASMWDFWGGLPFMRVFADCAATVTREGEAWRQRQFASLIGQPGRLGALFAEAGLDQVSEADIAIRQEFSGFEDWWGPWRDGQGVIGSFLAGLPPLAQGRLEKAARKAYLAGAPDGPRSFVATARLAHGRRS
jgi:SAM-dependent methyltransferase